MRTRNDSPLHTQGKGLPHTMFQMQPLARADYPGRSDLFIGYTAVPALWERIQSSDAIHSRDFSSCGETFCYLKIDGVNGLEGSAFADKAEIEDALDEALRHFKVGCVIGSGTGLRYSYIDLAVTDTRSAFDIVRKVLRAGKIPERSWIQFFDTEKAGEWIGVWDAPPEPPR